MPPREVTVPEGAGGRADTGLAALTGVSRTAAARIIAGGGALRRGVPLKKSDTLLPGDVVTVTLPDPEPAGALPQDIPLDILYEDDVLLVVNKPKGMVVHPAPGNRDGTLVNALLYHCGDSLSGIGGVARPGILHRIDKDTSGLLLVAKTDEAHRFLAARIKAHSFTRVYDAVVTGRVRDERGTVDAPIGRDPVHRKKMAVTERNSKPALTRYEVVARYRGYTRLRVRLETGRTHQIRVHMAYIGHPVAGDAVYGKREPTLSGQCLHAGTLGFVHPVTGEYMEFNAPPPPYFTDFLRTLGGPDGV